MCGVSGGLEPNLKLGLAEPDGLEKLGFEKLGLGPLGLEKLRLGPLGFGELLLGFFTGPSSDDALLLSTVQVTGFGPGPQ